MANILKDTMGKSWCFSFIGGVYLLQNRFKEAEDYQLRALAIMSNKQNRHICTRIKLLRPLEYFTAHGASMTAFKILF